MQQAKNAQKIAGIARQAGSRQTGMGYTCKLTGIAWAGMLAGHVMDCRS